MRRWMRMSKEKTIRRTVCSIHHIASVSLSFWHFSSYSGLASLLRLHRWVAVPISHVSILVSKSRDINTSGSQPVASSTRLVWPVSIKFSRIKLFKAVQRDKAQSRSYKASYFLTLFSVNSHILQNQLFCRKIFSIITQLFFVSI